jgi:hypothetical protein
MKLLLATALLTVSFSSFALENCKGDLSNDARYQGTDTRWTKVELRSTSADVIDGCPSTIVSTKNWVFHLSQISETKCAYQSGAARVKCSK